ncbi:MAG: 2-dehydropantoate 2-reductase [Pseudomonadota bacterium]
MKICVVGPGAIGAIVVAALDGVAGVTLSTLARGAHLTAIQAGGLRVLGPDGGPDGGERRIAVAASDNPAALGAQDAVVLCLKAHQAWAAAESLAPLLGPETAVVTCQNGAPWWWFHRLAGPFEGRRLTSVDPGDRQWAAIGPERAIGCAIFAAGEVIGPGAVRHGSGRRFILGEPSGEATQRLARLAEVFTAGGLDAPMAEDIRSEIWFKLWGNVSFNPISALTGQTLDKIAADPGTRGVARAMMLEAQAVAERLGARFPMGVDERLEITKRVGAHRTSMLQDLEAGRPLELDALVGVVQEMGRIADAPTPVIDTVLALTRSLASARGLL